MKSKGILVTALIVITVIFTAFNWGALSTYLPINFLFFQVQLPLGLFLIGAFLLACLLFLLLSLFRRAGQLRHVMHIERQLDEVQKKLEKQRSDEIVGLENKILGRLDGLETRMSETDTGFRTVVSEHTNHIEAHERAQVERLEERVLLMRNELAADIAQVESSLRKSLPSSGSGSGSFSDSASSSGSTSSSGMSTKPDITVVDKEVKRAP